MEEKGCTHVTVELRETFILREVRVPKTNGLVNVELSCQVAANPPIGEVHKVDIQLFKISQDLGVCLLNQGFHFIDDLVNSWLKFRVVVLNAVNDFTETPESISLCLEKVF